MGDIALAMRRPAPGEIAREDARLVARLCDGDELALAALYRRYGRYVYSLAVDITSDAGAGEEVTQDVFTSVWRNAKRYRADQASVGTWIMRIARNRAIDEARRGRTRTRSVAPGSEERFLAIADGRADLEGDVVDDETRDEVRVALERLPAEQRQAISLAFFQGYTHAEIAAALRQPVGTVKTRIRLGMQKLRGLLEEAGNPPDPRSDGRHA